MKNRIAVLLSVLCGFFLSAANAENKTPTQTAAAAVQRGMLYRVRHQHNTTYLFGTIHVGKPAFYPLEKEVMNALAGASTLVVEADPRDIGPLQDALKKYGFYPAGDSIARHLSAESRQQLRQALDRFSIPLDSIAFMKPWLVSNMLITLDLERNGYHQNHGTELFLLSLAKEQTKPVYQLESAEYQLSLYDNLTDAEQEQYLRESLEQLMDGSALKKAQLLIDAWAHANGKAFDDLLQESLNEKTIGSEFLHRVLLGKRNPEMTEKIEALLKNEEATFVGVGLLHLVGEDGIPALLRRRGYEVEKLY